MNKKTVSIQFPQIGGVGLKSATVDLKKGVITVEYGQEDTEKDISEIAVDFKSATEYLHEDAYYLPAISTTKKHIPKLKAFNQLLILSEAWNKFDEFKPDWEDPNQYKYYPLFELINGKFEFTHVSYGQIISDTQVSNFAFKSTRRAEQFGRQFIELFRIVLS